MISCAIIKFFNHKEDPQDSQSKQKWYKLGPLVAFFAVVNSSISPLIAMIETISLTFYSQGLEITFFFFFLVILVYWIALYFWVMEEVEQTYPMMIYPKEGGNIITPDSQQRNEAIEHSLEQPIQDPIDIPAPMSLPYQ